MPILPDGFFTLETEEKVFHHFLEVDRGTVVGQSSKPARSDWSRRVRAYNEYVSSGAFERRYGGRGLRFLTVTSSESRLANLMRITEKAGGTNRWWFTTFDRVAPDTVFAEPIWYIATRQKPQRLVW